MYFSIMAHVQYIQLHYNQNNSVLNYRLRLQLIHINPCLEWDAVDLWKVLLY